MKAEPQDQHRWLQQLVGEWAYEHEATMGPDQPVQKFTGTEIVRPLGDLWVVCEGRSEMPGGGEAHMRMTLGYDPGKGRFVGTWVGSMMTYLWVYDGELDAAGKVLTLNAEGPNFADPSSKALVKYQDVIGIVSHDHRTLTSRTLGPDGTWHEFMTAHYRRK